MKHLHTLRLDNPIVEARHLSGQSLEQLGRRLSLSKQYLSRAEQATYSGLNPALVGWAANLLDVSPGKIMAGYFKFQASTRHMTMQNVNPRLVARRGSSKPGWEIFREWRENYWTSVTAFSNALCVHPESVRNYEEGMISAMPDQLRKALVSVKLIDPNWTEQPPNATHASLTATSAGCGLLDRKGGQTRERGAQVAS